MYRRNKFEIGAQSGKNKIEEKKEIENKSITFDRSFNRWLFRKEIDLIVDNLVKSNESI